MPRISGSLTRVLKAFAKGDKPWPIRPILEFAVKTRMRNSVAINDFSRVHRAVAESLGAELDKVLSFRDQVDSTYYQRRFERDFAALCGRKYALGTNSGTAALEFSLKVMGIGAGDEVITVPNSYIASSLAISNVGAVPVFVDVDPSGYNMDPSRIAAAIGPRTKAILPVHLYGQMADMPAILSIAVRHGLKVIVDACQAFGAKLGEKGSGHFGDAVCYSFSTPKTLSGFGNGGMILTDDKAAIAALRRIRDPESLAPDLLRSGRTPCFLDPVQIAFIRAKLPHVEGWIESRRALAARYKSVLGAFDLTLPAEMPGARHTYYNFPVQSAERDGLRSHLHRKGVRTGIHYTPLIHLNPCYAELGFKRGAFPVSEGIEARTLSLPISPFLAESEVEKVLGAVAGFYG
jgi:dTDP-4-amino-4,6-dideoxygalactose transaminase